MTMELISLLGGTILGYFFKFAAMAQKDRADQFAMLLKDRDSQNALYNDASKRDNDDSGKKIRRFLVVSMVFAVILAPFILAMIGKPIIVEVDQPIKTWFLGLFQTGGGTKFYELPSYVLIPEVRAGLLGILGYYWGGSSAKRS